MKEELTPEEIKETSPKGSWYVGCMQCAERIARAQLAKCQEVVMGSPQKRPDLVFPPEFYEDVCPDCGGKGKQQDPELKEGND